VCAPQFFAWKKRLRQAEAAKFVEVTLAAAAPEIAREAVAFLRTLYAVEKQAREASVEERWQLRQARSLPVLAELHEKLLTWKEQLLPKHPMAEAVNYTLGQWEELNVTCKNGAVPIDNNERARDETDSAEQKKFPLCREPAWRPHRIWAHLTGGGKAKRFSCSMSPCQCGNPYPSVKWVRRPGACRVAGLRVRRAAAAPGGCGRNGRAGQAPCRWSIPSRLLS
jgi:hypothetical protein